jgi:ATP-dependent Clp protease ATP-binding subunit ClpC
MRESLSETLSEVLEHAQHEARRLNQEFVGNEHLMLGILHCDGCEAARALRTQHIDIRQLRAGVLEALPKGEQDPVVTGALPLTPKAQRAVNSALARAQALREGQVSTRLVLLSIIEERGTMVRELLRSCGADLDMLERKLAQRPQQAEA